MTVIEDDIELDHATIFLLSNGAIRISRDNDTSEYLNENEVSALLENYTTHV